MQPEASLFRCRDTTGKTSKDTDRGMKGVNRSHDQPEKTFKKQLLVCLLPGGRLSRDISTFARSHMSSGPRVTDSEHGADDGVL